MVLESRLDGIVINPSSVYNNMYIGTGLFRPIEKRLVNRYGPRAGARRSRRPRYDARSNVYRFPSTQSRGVRSIVDIGHGEATRIGAKRDPDTMKRRSTKPIPIGKRRSLEVRRTRDRARYRVHVARDSSNRALSSKHTAS